jgi:hypothetical protein
MLITSHVSVCSGARDYHPCIIFIGIVVVAIIHRRSITAVLAGVCDDAKRFVSGGGSQAEADSTGAT